MPFLPKNSINHRGSTYIGIIIALGIFSILSYTVIELIVSTYQIVIYSRSTTTARHLAQESLEVIRNMPYTDIGTLGGVPAGQLEQTSNRTLNGNNYTIRTEIIYVDDDFDGVAPTDLQPQDYKKVQITVIPGGITQNVPPVTLVTNISPIDVPLEDSSGTLRIVAFDSQANPVPNANVHIFADSITPQVDVNHLTNESGEVVIPGAKTCVECYQITVTKEGYSSDKTYSTDEVANPLKTHLTVLENDLTESSFSIDHLSSLNLTSLGSRENEFPPTGNVNFTLQGSKTIGTDSQGEIVYKNNIQLTTNAEGLLEADDIEWDTYKIIPDENWSLAGSNPPSPFEILPGTENTISFSVSDISEFNLLANFKDSSNNTLSEINVTFYDDQGFVATSSSGLVDTPDFGYVFFPDLEEKDYTLEATASGFLDLSDVITITGQDSFEYIMNPSP